MTKFDFMDIMKEDGFTVTYDDGMAIILVDSSDEISNVIKHARSYLDEGEIAFPFSWGVRVREKIVTEYMKDHENPRILKTE